jgi:hypothetical protein
VIQSHTKVRIGARYTGYFILPLDMFAFQCNECNKGGCLCEVSRSKSRIVAPRAGTHSASGSSSRVRGYSRTVQLSPLASRGTSCVQKCNAKVYSSEG